MVLRFAALTLAFTAIVSCGGLSSSSERERRSRIEAAGETRAETARAQLAPIAQRAIRRCAELAPRRSIPILCPTRLPEARWFVRYQTLQTGRNAYLTNFETRPVGAGQAFHVLAGGRRGSWPLLTAGGTWPPDTRMERDLSLMPVGSLEPGEGPQDLERARIPVVGSATVDTHRALILRAADYPTGGVHGGHLAVIWNQDGNGYALSMHFAGDNPWSAEEREDVLLQAASAMSRFDPPRRISDKHRQLRFDAGGLDRQPGVDR